MYLVFNIAVYERSCAQIRSAIISLMNAQDFDLADDELTSQALRVPGVNLLPDLDERLILRNFLISPSKNGWCMVYASTGWFSEVQDLSVALSKKLDCVTLALLIDDSNYLQCVGHILLPDQPNRIKRPEEFPHPAKTKPGHRDPQTQCLEDGAAKGFGFLWKGYHQIHGGHDIPDLGRGIVARKRDMRRQSVLAQDVFISVHNKMPVFLKNGHCLDPALGFLTADGKTYFIGALAQQCRLNQLVKHLVFTRVCPK